MSLERWNQFTLQQQFGNIAAELGRASSQSFKGSNENCNLSLFRVLEMINYLKSNYNNTEIFRFYEYVAELTINNDKACRPA